MDSTQINNINNLLVDKVSSIVSQWINNIPKSSSIFSYILGKVKISDLLNFSTNGIDELIQFVEQFAISGSDKKTLVLNAASVIYDYVSLQAMPIFLKPFNVQIKNFVINVVISNVIDFLVSKYNIGGWINPPVSDSSGGTNGKVQSIT